MLCCNNKRSVVVISWIVTLLWMLAIFSLSAQPRVQSNNLSTSITEKIIEVVEIVVPSGELNIENLNHVMRKNAHFFAYLVLGILAVNAIKVSGVSKPKSYALAIGICFIYAISDEVHQLFVPGRGGQLSDVVLDTIGGAVGIGFYALVRNLTGQDRR